jgi:hypothetical protein
MVDPWPPALPSDAELTADKEATISQATRADEIGAASFPASDPPAVWTWEVKKTKTEPSGR